MKSELAISREDKRPPTDKSSRIKKAYRKKALELHPDRNYGNVEETTKLFTEVQSAYDVLSDPQERAWYDSHRDSILRDINEPSEDHFEHNVRVTTAQDIMRMFARLGGRLDYSDSVSSFYGMLRRIFDDLAREERLACEWENLELTPYPSFGYPHDDYETTVKPFYAAWSSFATSKPFSWKDVYRYSDAPDRRIRRMMEKENRRFREEGIREFNDAVRSLVAFVRKRDPRYKKDIQSEADRGKALRDAALAQAARSRAANQAKLAQSGNLPDWTNNEESKEPYLGEYAQEEEKLVEEQYECIVCKKVFKSEKQYQTHERSKKHIKAAQQIRYTLENEDKNLGLRDLSHDFSSQEDEPSVPNLSNSQGFAHDNKTDDTLDNPKSSSPYNTHVNPSNVEETANDPNDDNAELANREIGGRLDDSTDSSSLDDDYASREQVKRRIQGDLTSSFRGSRSISPVDHLSRDLSAKSLNPYSESNKQAKLGKAKAKRYKKAVQKPPPLCKCATCGAEFPSKTKLFDHLRDLDHEQPVGNSIKAGKVRNR